MISFSFGMLYKNMGLLDFSLVCFVRSLRMKDFDYKNSNKIYPKLLEEIGYLYMRFF